MLRWRFARAPQAYVSILVGAYYSDRFAKRYCKIITSCISLLTEIGYEYKGEAGVPDRYFFVKGSEKCRTHYLHIEELNRVNWRNHVLFRDSLHNHPKEASDYSELKRGLAEKYANDRDTYAKGKNPFIEKIIKAANEIYAFDYSGKTKMI